MGVEEMEEVMARINAKRGQIKIAYGRPDRHDDPDICVAWGGGGADKSDGRYVLHALTEPRLGYSLPSMEVESRPSVVEELERRGYDIATLRLTISRKDESAAIAQTQDDRHND